MFGREYVIEHCISTLNFYKKQEVEEKSFKIYVTDALMMIAENATHLITNQGVVDYGKYFKQRWIDTLEQPQKKKEEKEDNRPSEEIAQDIWKRIRGH